MKVVTKIESIIHMSCHTYKIQVSANKIYHTHTHNLIQNKSCDTHKLGKLIYTQDTESRGGPPHTAEWGSCPATPQPYARGGSSCGELWLPSVRD